MPTPTHVPFGLAGLVLVVVVVVVALLLFL